MNMKAPCRGCGKRFVGCHGKKDDGTYRCAEYGAFREKVEESRKRAQVGEATQYMIDYTMAHKR